MNEQLNDMERLFLAFSDKTRLQILYLLRDGEVGVNAICDKLHTSQPKVSRHLAYLRAMNLVTTRRDGKSIYYKLDIPSDPFGASVVEETIDWLDSFSREPGTRKRRKPAPRPIESVPDPQPQFVDERQIESEPEYTSEPEYVEREMEVYLL
jgi:ArsR family transcriptional regulator